MTDAGFCASGMNEDVKGGVHAATALLLGTMAFYNAYAYWRRRDQHLLTNTLLYGGLTAWELRRAFQHWKAHASDRPARVVADETA